MNREQLLIDLTAETSKIWDVMAESYPKLVKFNPPTIILSGRLWRTAGRCFWENNKVELGVKFFAKYPVQMKKIILPHEIAHQIHYNLVGGVPSEKEWHGKLWAEIMNNYGLPADEFHTMDIARK